MRVGIIGAGAVGMLIAGYIAKSHDVTLYTKRFNQEEIIKENGINLYQSSERLIQTNVHVKCLSDELDALDCCFISVKQPSLPNLLETLQAFPKELPLIFIQNGMGHLDILEEFTQPVYIGIVEHGTKRMSDYEVEHRGKGHILLASYSGEKNQLQVLTTELNQNDFPFDYTTNWENAVKDKMLVNSVINPLTALFQVPNEDILMNESICRLAKKLCKESTTVLHMDDDSAWNNVVTIALKTGKNSSSMLQDILEKRKTEIQSISGYLLQEATVSLPYTTFVYESIKALERKG